MDIENEDLEFLEDLSEEEEDETFSKEVETLVEQAFVFFDREMDLYDDVADLN